MRRWAVAPGASSAAGAAVRILGIDPGSVATGFGVIDWASGTATYVASGTIRTRGGEFPPRLRQIFDGVLEVMREVRGYLQQGNYEVGRVLARELATWFKSHAATMDAMLAQVLKAHARPLAADAA